jgi:hypothetical protein
MPSPLPEDPTPQSDGKRSVSGGDFVLLVLVVFAGFGIWFLVDRTLTHWFSSYQPNEERLMFDRGVTAQQAELTRAQTEIDELQKALTAAQLEQIKQEANIGTLVSAYPALADDASRNKAPSELVKSYWEAKRQEHTADAVVFALEGRLRERRSSARAVASAFQQNKLDAQVRFHRETALYLLAKPALSLLATFFIVFALLFLVDLVLLLLTGQRIAKAKRFQPYLIVIALLLVLFGYQAFELAGAALVGIIVLIVVLRKIDWPRKSAKADAVVK